MTPRRGLLPFIIAALPGIACGGNDTAPPSDGGTDASPDADLVAAPNIPWLADGAPGITLTPCAEGWREVEDTMGLSACRAYPEGGPSACGPGEAHFVGEAACRAVGDACPAGVFADGLPTDAPVVYVDAAAAPGGDGSRAAPYTALSQVSFSTLRSGTTIALGGGAYEGVLALRAGVSVVGRCAADTTLTGLDAPVAAAVVVTSDGDPAVLRNVTIDNPPQSGAQVDAGRVLSMSGVVVRGAFGTGIAIFGGHVEATDVLVDTTRPDPTRPFSSAVLVAEGGGFEATELVLSDNGEYGIIVGDPESTATLADVAVLGTRSAARSADAGWGIVAVDEGRVEVARAALLDNEGHGFFVQGEGASLTLRDAVIAETRIARHGEGGWGIAGLLGGVVDAERVLIANNHGAGIGTTGPGTEVGARHVIVRDTAEISNGTEGRALIAQDGASVTVDTAALVNNREVGAFAGRGGSSLSLTDVAIVGTQPRAADGEFGRAVGVQTDTVFTATRVLIEDNYDVGLFLSHADSTLTDVLVRNTLPYPESGYFGFGAQLEGAASYRLERVAVEGAYEVGVLIGIDADVLGTDVTVDRVARSACDCERTFGYGIDIYGANLSLDRFRVAGSEVCGLFLTPGDFGQLPEVDLTRGVVSQSEIGACVQVDGYDLDRLSADVDYQDNGTNLQATMLPVPTPPSGL